MLAHSGTSFGNGHPYSAPVLTSDRIETASIARNARLTRLKIGINRPTHAWPRYEPIGGTGPQRPLPHRVAKLLAPGAVLGPPPPPLCPPFLLPFPVVLETRRVPLDRIDQLLRVERLARRGGLFFGGGGVGDDDHQRDVGEDPDARPHQQQAEHADQRDVDIEIGRQPIADAGNHLRLRGSGTAASASLFRPVVSRRPHRRWPLPDSRRWPRPDPSPSRPDPSPRR